jgi:Ca2+-binding EF-hand superfamily protein
MVTPEELRAAFSFLDADKTGMISMTGLKKRLGVFFPEMSAKDYRFLMNNKKELTYEV